MPCLHSGRAHLGMHSRGSQLHFQFVVYAGVYLSM